MMNDETIVRFAQGLRGSVIGRDDADYDEARKLYNGMIDKRPLLIARCADAADVIAAVNFGRDNGLTIAVRGGAHNGPGLGSVDDGLVIDMSLMKGVRVDPAKRTARVGGGCVTGDVDHATCAFGQAVPFGVISTTGVAGLTLSGGHGYLSRQYGLAADNLLEADVVLADGRFVTASENENADLLWGLRGGGGNFGVVTSFLFRTNPVGTLYAGPIIFDLADAATVMRWYRQFQANSPRRILHLSRVAVGAAGRAVPAGTLGQEDVRAARLASRPRRREGGQRDPRGTPHADHRLGAADGVPDAANHVRPALSEGPAMVLEGRLRQGTAGCRYRGAYRARRQGAEPALPDAPLSGRWRRPSKAKERGSLGPSRRDLVDGDRSGSIPSRRTPRPSNSGREIIGRRCTRST